MELVAANPGGSGVPPFHDHDVREWSRIDSITGALERARLETDSWTANTNNSSHKYGKVVDSRARTGADGALHQQARRQLEVFQSQIPGGHLQVVKTHTVSSSRWMGKPTSSVTGDDSGLVKNLENLHLTLNPLDLSPQKSKASVGRSVGRRPPSRQHRPRVETNLTSDDGTRQDTFPGNSIRNPHLTAVTNLHRVSRLCHQIHENAVRQAFGNRSSTPSISERQTGDGSASSGVEIYEIESATSSETKSTNGHSNLTRTKSTSSDDINFSEKDSSTKSIEDLDDLEQLQNWRRTSKIRRSLQFPKQNKPSYLKPQDLPGNSISVRKIREDLEKGRRLNTALRNNSVDLEALDQILQSISSSSSVDKNSISDDTLDDKENDKLISKTKQKRDSFVTVESLQEVKGRLRRTSSPTKDIYKARDEETDDGIVTEEPKEFQEKSNSQSRVRSYVYGMETMLKKPILGTGSLESRSKLVNGNINRSEDWYNRRKSYGFEEVHGHNESSNTISLKNKNIIESSTDSGICRSSEIVVVPAATKTNTNSNNQYDSDNVADRKYSSYGNTNTNGINYGSVKKMANILNQEDRNPYYSKTAYDELSTKRNNHSSFKENYWKPNEIKATTIKIPIVKNNNIVDLLWNDEPEKEIKRHSIAVDESKYVIKNNEPQVRRTSLALNDQFKADYLEDDILGNNRKTKKVEFCKTEVHFAADSGKVNIVETDEKPPPTQNFRRRRRNSGPIITNSEDLNKNGLSLLHFGDSSYEKTMFGVPEDAKTTQNINNRVYENIPSRVALNFGPVTVNTNHQTLDYQEEDKRDSENENIKGILKNKPIKPKPYHMGEPIFKDENSDEDNKNWGVRLRPVHKEDIPIWKSTVTVHNSYYDNNESKHYNIDENEEKPEFQKLLKNLRPVKKLDYLSDNENRYSNSFSNIRIVPPLRDSRRSSWSVADKIKLTEDTTAEGKGYSTKVNFGDGEATVVETDRFYENDRNPAWPSRLETLPTDTTERPKSTENSSSSDTHSLGNILYNKYNINPKVNNVSPVVLRKMVPVIRDLKTDITAEKLSSPSLVSRNKSNSPKCKRNIEASLTDRESPSNQFRNIADNNLQTKHIHENIVLRQPKKSEMTYFGVSVSPKSVKPNSQAVIKNETQLSEKPDLLQHYKHSDSPTRTKSRKASPETKRVKSPLYENIKYEKGGETRNKYNASRAFDSSILDELTKAADQILQAVNGYTDEDSHNKQTSEDETKKRNTRTKQLDTISETKSWKNDKEKHKKTKPPNLKPKLKNNSSASSVESLSKERRRVSSSTERNQIASKSTNEKEKKNFNDSVKANTKARRLQRASSREALLQSHGSSSEDLVTTVEIPIRKPRLVKKTKSTQLTVTNGLELKKKESVTSRKREDIVNNKPEERVLGSLPQIRHKTAVSTIKSTREKSPKDRLKQRNEDLKKKTPQKKESNKVSSSANRTTEKSCKKVTAAQNKETVTHRISTANIQKCLRLSDGGTRH